MPNDLLCTAIDIADENVIHLHSSLLPNNWNAKPPISETARIGDDWVLSQSSLALRVPSAVTNGEHNVLINPAHPRFSEVLFQVVGPADLDPRILKRRP
jgi:RES domain-containing protein